MNVALPALVIFLLLLPGFVVRTRLKRAERTSLDYSPFGQVAAEAILWALVAHLAWLASSYFIFDRYFEPSMLLKLLSSDPASQAKATDAVGKSFGWISAYFASLLLGAFAIPKCTRYLISKYRLDRESTWLSSTFRFHDAPWYYLLTGADFESDEQPDAIVISAIVDVAGEAILYTGFLDEFFFSPEGDTGSLGAKNSYAATANG